MNYEEAKVRKNELETKNKEDSDTLRTFDSYNLANGLVPDHIRELPEWKEAKQAYDHSFAELRTFNGWYVKAFKKEIQQDRRKKYSK